MQESSLIKLSRRMLEVKSSPTVALNAKAKAMAATGIKVANFAVGEPDFPTPESVVNVAIAALRAGHTKYGAAGGGPAIRQAIAQKLRRDNGLDVADTDIVVGMGAKEILFHVFLAVINEGDEVLVPSPYWVSYPDQIIAAGGKPVYLPLPADIADAPIDIAAIERTATERTTGILLNSPNNPAGYVLAEKDLRALGELLKRNNWWIIADEIYEYLAFDRPHVSLLKLFPELKDRFILVNGMSKGYAMTGWRVGYCAGPAATMKLVRDLQSHSSTCLPPFIEEAATFALQQGPQLLAKEFQELKARRDLTCRLFDERRADDRGVENIRLGYVAPQGAFYVFIDARNLIKSGKIASSMALAAHFLAVAHVAVVPGEAFGAPGYLRLSYATDAATIEAGVRRMIACAAAL